MSQTDPASSGGDPPADERQLTLEEFDDQCQAIAEYTSEPCQNQAIMGSGYCPQHLDWNDVDIDGG
jgi:hypothetical protein